MNLFIGVHGRFHAFDLASQMAQRGASVTLATTYPALVARKFVPAGVRLLSRPSLEMLRRIRSLLPWPHSHDVDIARSFSRFAAASLPNNTSLFVGWSSASLEAMVQARNLGIPTVLERGSTHIAHQAAILAEEFGCFGMSETPVDPRMIDREIEEYARADVIAVPTRFAAETFASRGISADRLMINPYGVDLDRFRAVSSPAGAARQSLRALFVGQVGLRKGVPWLLRAHARSGVDAELHLVGPIARPMRRILAAESRGRVIVHGPLRGRQLDKVFAAADIFCLPSLEEGLPLAALQAMAAGLPVILTPEAGADDLISNGVEGYIVPSRNPDALAEALMRLSHPDVRQSMGAAARRRVAAGFTWNDYGERAAAAYQRILGTSRIRHHARLHS